MNRNIHEFRPGIGNMIIGDLQEVIGRVAMIAMHTILPDLPIGWVDESPVWNGDMTKAAATKIQSSVESHFGSRCGQGIMYRTGQAFSRDLVRLHSDYMGFSRLEFRLLPLRKRLRTGLEILANQASLSLGMVIHVRDSGNSWIWSQADCPWCQGRHSDRGICQFNAGMVQEFLAWASGGRFYQVREIECKAAGETACVVEIIKQPLE